MKIEAYCARSCRASITKLLLIMKLTAILVLALCFQVRATGYSQTVTLSLENTPLQKVFAEITRQTGYQFIYTDSVLKAAPPVNVVVVEVDLKLALEACFKSLPLTYQINDKYIVISFKSISPTLQSNVPPQEISGLVTDLNGTRLEGVSIFVKGTNKGTLTNVRGEFLLKGIDKEVILVVTSVGFNKQEVRVSPASTNLRIKIEPAESNLDAAQVIAYGKTSRRFSTGNIGTVTGAEIEKQPVSNPLLALQGRVPGLLITQQSGVTGGGVQVRVQGQNSIASGNEPLIVIDGVPYFSTMPNLGVSFVFTGPPTTGVTASPLNFINPSDIESIDVLKDADATAIYGSRAANGALLITTKKGKAGKTSLNVNVQHGWGEVTRKMDVLNTRQYLDMRYEAYKNDGIATIPATAYDLKLWDTTRYTDWQKELIGGTAQFTQANASLSGGSETVQYLLAGTYQRQTTVFPGDFSDNRGTFHFNISNTSLNKRFRIQLSASYMTGNNKLPTTDLTQSAYGLPPIAPALYTSEGELNWAPNAAGTSTWTNPFATILYQRFKSQTNNLNSSLVIGYRILPGLEISSTLGFTQIDTKDFSPTPLLAIRPENRITNNPNGTQRSALYGQRNMRSFMVEPQLSYKTKVGPGQLGALAGFSIQQSRSNTYNLLGTGYGNDQVLEDMRAALSITAQSTSFSEYKYAAGFGRLQYNLWNRYILSLNARRDGSSRFGDRNKFQNFGSVGMAWIFSEAKFFQEDLPFVSFGKLRASYGSTGNDQVGDYAAYSLYGAPTSVNVPYQGTPSLESKGLLNPYLQWEVTRKLQGGIDLGFLNDKISLSATYVRNRSSNQLVTTSMALTTGFGSVSENRPALVQNSSWEFFATSKNIVRKSFSWSTCINLTIPRNKLLKFPGIEETSYASGILGVIVGQPLGIKKVYAFGGVDPTTGLYVFQNAAGELTSSPKSATDRLRLVSLLPRYYGGIQNTISIGNVQIDFLIQFIKQLGTGFAFNNINPGRFAGNNNQPVWVLDRWQKTGDQASFQKYSNSSLTTQLYAQASDAFYVDASYARLKNLSISWSMPEKWKQRAHLPEFRLYIQGQNLFTITSYKGPDPENQSGVTLPPMRLLTCGVQIGL